MSEEDRKGLLDIIDKIYKELTIAPELKGKSVEFEVMLVASTSAEKLKGKLKSKMLLNLASYSFLDEGEDPALYSKKLTSEQGKELEISVRDSEELKPLAHVEIRVIDNNNHSAVSSYGNLTVFKDGCSLKHEGPITQEQVVDILIKKLSSPS